jgi:hypothetical protein
MALFAFHRHRDAYRAVEVFLVVGAEPFAADALERFLQVAPVGDGIGGVVRKWQASRMRRRAPEQRQQQLPLALQCAGTREPVWKCNRSGQAASTRSR